MIGRHPIIGVHVDERISKYCLLYKGEIGKAYRVACSVDIIAK